MHVHCTAFNSMPQEPGHAMHGYYNPKQPPYAHKVLGHFNFGLGLGLGLEP